MRKIKLIAVIAVLVAMFSVIASAEGLLIAPNPMAQETVAEDTAKTAIVFSDIDENATYKDAVYKLVSNGVLNGYLDGTFRPENSVTRAEMCKMINLTFGYVDTEGAAGFPDLVPGEWYIPYVLAAQKAGYVQGDDVGTFRPEDSISREEVCAILYRIIKPYDLDIPVVIKDEVSEWARPYVEAMIKNALIPLDAEGTFRATLPIKRHELATAVAPHSNIKVDAVKCTVTFLNADAVYQTLQVSIGKAFETLPVLETVPVGYKFVGWSKLANEAVLVDSSTIFFENTTLYAHFEKLEYKVKFIIDSNLQVSETTVKYKEFAAKPINPVKSGYTFKGWSIDGKTVIDVATYEIINDTVFTAVFTKEETSFGGGGSGGGGGGGSGSSGGSGGSGSGSSGGSGGSGSGDSGSDEGGNGGGGSGDNGSDEGGNGDGGNGEGGADDEEEIIIRYTVTFIVEDETYGTQVVVKGEAPEAPDEPELKGYVFLYWSDEKGGSRVNLKDEEIFGDTSFYAVFALEDTNPNEDETIEALKLAAKKFRFNVSATTDYQAEVKKTVLDTIDAVLVDAENGEYIDSDYVKENYQTELKKVNKILDKDMSKSEKSEFITRVMNAFKTDKEKEAFNILADFFLSESTKEEYLPGYGD